MLAVALTLERSFDQKATVCGGDGSVAFPHVEAVGEELSGFVQGLELGSSASGEVDVPSLAFAKFELYHAERSPPVHDAFAHPMALNLGSLTP